MYKPELDFEQLFRNIIKHSWLVALIFAVISIAVTTMGYLAPKHYASYSTLLFDEGRIITPLLDGAAVPKNNNTLSTIAEEIIYSRKTLTRLGQELGMIDGDVDSYEEEVNLNKLTGRVGVDLQGKRYLQTRFVDDTPEGAQKGATILADLFIGQNQGGKEEETRNAYEFIDAQVQQYHKKLLAAEEKLKGFQVEKLASGAGSEQAVTMRLQRLQEMLDQAELDLKEAYIQRSSLQRQLKGEVQTTVSLSKQSQYIARIQVLQEELARLRLNYHETYPDIVDLKHQIADQEKLMAQEKRNSSRTSAVVDDTVRLNEVYQDLKLRLSNADTQVATLQTRVTELKGNIATERTKGKHVSDVDAKLAELTRDYDVNKNIYEDLLKRREKARVSMEVESDESNSNITLYEPAFLPVNPSGLGFLHYLVLGLGLGVILPVVGLYLFQIVDSKIKSEHYLTSKMKVPVLASINEIRNDIDIRRDTGSRLARMLFYGMTFAVLVMLAYLRMTQQG
jgi:polysaccharide chain length determinant protein (PEP-CTERM system associated)